MLFYKLLPAFSWKYTTVAAFVLCGYLQIQLIFLIYNNCFNFKKNRLFNHNAIMLIFKLNNYCKYFAFIFVILQFLKNVDIMI